MKEKPKRAYGFSKRAGLKALMKVIENDAYLKCLWEAEVEKYEMQTYYTLMNGHWPGKKPIPQSPVIGLMDREPLTYKDIMKFWYSCTGLDGILNSELKPWDPILLDRCRTKIGNVYMVSSIPVETNPWYQIWDNEIPTDFKPNGPVYWERNNDLGMMGFRDEYFPDIDTNDYGNPI